MNSDSMQRQFSLNVGWGDIHLDLGSNELIVHQHWCYRWDLLRGAEPVTLEQIDAWHERVQQAINSAFHGQRLQLVHRQGRKKVRSTVGVRLQILNAPQSRQWVVGVRRVPADCQVPVSAMINPGLRTISATESDWSVIELSRTLHRQLLPLLVAELNRLLPGLRFEP